VTAHLIPNQILDGLTLINPGKANQLLAPITQLITSRIERSVRNLYKEKLLLPHLRSAEHFYKKPLQKVPSKKALAILEEQRIDSLPILNLIPAHQRQELIKRLSFFKAQKNQYVFNKGDQDGAVYHVLSGALQTFIQARGKTTKLTIIGPGGSSGLIHFINQSQSMINCVVREDAFLLKITREELDAITKEFPLASDKIRLFLLKSIATTFNKFYMHYLQSKSIHHLF
jgi:reverse gyrase